MKHDLNLLERSGRTVVVVGRNRKVIGLVGMMDSLRPESKATVRNLADLGVSVTMLTGDNK